MSKNPPEKQASTPGPSSSGAASRTGRERIERGRLRAGRISMVRRRAQACDGSPRPPGPHGPGLRPRADPASRRGDVGHEDRPPRRSGLVPRRRGGRVVADRGPRARPGRPVRRLPVPDGAVLRARAGARALAVARAPAVARAGPVPGRVGDRAADGRAGGPPARRRAPDRRPAVPAQPVRGRVHRAHLGDAARLRRAAVAAAVRVPRPAVRRAPGGGRRRSRSPSPARAAASTRP